MSAWLEPLEKGRCQKWRLHSTTGSGRNRKHRSRRFDGGKREANAALLAFDAEPVGALEDPMLADYLAEWNDRRLETGACTQHTHENYGHVLAGMSMHICKKVSEVSAWDVEGALAALKSGDSPSGRQWSGTTLRTAYKVLKKAMDDAVERGICTRNPCTSVKPPRTDTKRRKALGLSDSAGLLGSLDLSDAHQFAVALMLCTGLRAGECVGANWEDVTPAGLLVRREVTKTDAGERVVPLDPRTWDMLAERIAWVAAKLDETGAEPDFSDALCCTDDGRGMTYNAMKHWWAKHRADYGLEGWTLHELRHTFATNLAQANVHPSTMAALLGHSSSEITMEIYTHVHNEDMENAIDALASARALKK